MRIRKHYFFTFAKRVTSRTYGGESYVLNVFENKGKGKFIMLGTASGCTRGHKGFESEAWSQVIFPKLSPKLKAEVCAEMDSGREQKGLAASYYSWTLRDSVGVKLEQY